jgi:hypothetical protein
MLQSAWPPTSDSIFELEHRVLRVDGTLGWIISRAIPVFDEAGEIIEWLGTATDLTDRKRGETQREESSFASRKRRAHRPKTPTVRRKSFSPRCLTSCTPRSRVSSAGCRD